MQLKQFKEQPILTDRPNMFYDASPLTFERAKILRRSLTPSEQSLWQELKANKLMGLRFKSQHPIDHFIVDFYCHKLKLVIVVDGEIHLDKDQNEYDKGRTYDLNQLGINVMRFRNEEIDKNLKKVIEQIKSECTHLLSPLQGVGGQKLVDNE